MRFGKLGIVGGFAPPIQWMNGGPEGCGHGTSEAQASEEDKRKFKRAVEIVHTLVKKAKRS